MEVTRSLPGGRPAGPHHGRGWAGHAVLGWPWWRDEAPPGCPQPWGVVFLSAPKSALDATRTSQPGTSRLVLRFRGEKKIAVHLFTRNNFVRCVKLSGQNDEQKEISHPVGRKSSALFHSWCYEMAWSYCTWKTLYKSMATGSLVLKLLEWKRVPKIFLVYWLGQVVLPFGILATLARMVIQMVT